MTKPIDVTPEDSVVPVFLDRSPQVPVVSEGPLDALLAERTEAELARSRAITKLTELGLTEDEARALGAS
ncbi:MAG: hypothetical protein LCH43_11235 [Actinobacteria bacterium]|nr:hypothetical protein [Actinomycetota bacterium]